MLNPWFHRGFWRRKDNFTQMLGFGETSSARSRILVINKLGITKLGLVMVNLAFGWVWITMGFLSGALLGMGFHRETFMGGYDSWSRRMARLGHIAFFGLGILNLLLARELAGGVTGGAIARGPARLASMTMNFGNVFLPLTLFAASAWRPAKYAMSLPATAVFVALSITAWQLAAGRKRGEV